MHSLLSLIVGFSLIAATAEGALSPFYESLVEYKALLNSQELASHLGSAEGIVDIKRTENGFIVTGNKHTLNVEVVYDRQEHPGPTKFHLIFSEPITRP